MSDIAILEHIIYLIKKYEDIAIEDRESFQRQFQIYMMSSQEDDRLPPSEPLKIEDKATEIITRIKAILENKIEG